MLDLFGLDCFKDIKDQIISSVDLLIPSKEGIVHVIELEQLRL